MPNEEIDALEDDELAGSSTDEESLEDTASEDASPEQDKAKIEKPLTKAELAAILRDDPEILKLIDQRARSISQSMVARSENRLTKRIRDDVKALERNKELYNLSDEQVQQARENIVKSAMFEDRDEGTNSHSREETSTDGTVHPLVLAAIQMMERGGTIVEAGTPEFDKYIKPIMDKGVIDETLLTATAYAMREMQDRLATGKKRAKLRSSGIGGNISSTSSADISSVDDPDELILLGERMIREGKLR